MCIDPLVGSQLGDLFGLNSDIGPVEIPVGILVISQLELHLPADSLDHVVPACGCAQDQLLSWFLFRRSLRWR